MPKSKKKSTKRSDKKLKYGKTEYLTYDDEKGKLSGSSSSSGTSSSSESYDSSSYSEPSGSDMAASSTSDVSDGAAYGTKKRRRKHKKKCKKRPYGSYSKKPEAPVASATKKPNLVRTIDSAELDDLNWAKTTLLVKVEDSLDNLRETAGYDADGNQKPLKLFLGQCVKIEKTTPDVHARVESNRSLKTATHEAMVSDAAQFADHRDVVKRVVVTGHNQFPGTVEVTLDNIQGSSDNVNYSSANGEAPTQSLVIRAEAGEKFEGRTMLRNRLTNDDINHFKMYSNATEKNLDEGVTKAPPRDGVPQYMVPTSEAKPNYVIHEICRSYKDDKRCTDEERKYMESTGEVPKNVIYVMEDYDDRVLVPRDLFDEYLGRCKAELKKKRPLSDVAHPFGSFSRVISDTHFRSESSKTRSTSAMTSSSKKQIWDHTEGLHTGLVSSQAKQNATKNVRSAWFRLDVYHAPIDQVGSKENALD